MKIRRQCLCCTIVQDKRLQVEGICWWPTERLVKKIGGHHGFNGAREQMSKWVTIIIYILSSVVNFQSGRSFFDHEVVFIGTNRLRPPIGGGNNDNFFHEESRVLRFGVLSTKEGRIFFRPPPENAARIDNEHPCGNIRWVFQLVMFTQTFLANWVVIEY